MAFLNKCMFIGNVGNEPQFKTFSTGKSASFSIAVSKKYTDANGNKKEYTSWIPCKVFGRLADVVQNLVTKGSQLYVEGEFNVNNYTDDSGNKKSFTCINVTSFQVLGNFKERGSSNDYREDECDGPYDEDGDMPF